jgi:predicted O-methyltransferase YrrM
MKHFFLIKQYIKYRLRAQNLHGVHSPFVFEFNKDVVNDTRNFYAFDFIQQLRDKLLANADTINVTDFGAGSMHTKSNTRRICDIAKLAGKQHQHGALLFRIINFYNCKNILELGTSLGIGTSYMASANANAQVTTLEGCPVIAAEAGKNFADINLQNVKQIVGSFNVTLAPLLAKTAPLDLVFVDGNHQYEPTLQYFEDILPVMADKSFLIFDDIHWSKGMQQAWQKIVADKRVLLTIDLFQFGICVMDTSFKEKQHFVIKM